MISPMMEFTPDDVKRLYGARLFVMPEDRVELLPSVEPTTNLPAEEPSPQEKEPAVVAPPPLDPQMFRQGSAIDWKMKANANLALLLPAAEFANRELTGLLKQAVLDAGINVARIGFGIYDDQAESWNFSDMPVSVAVVCGGCGGRLSAPLNVDQKELFPAPALAEAHRDLALKETLKAVLRQVNTALPG
jgi:hypothetical protein